MILVKNKWFPFGNYKAINICGIVFYKGDNLSDKTINHEKIHTKQMIELLFIFFYLWYGIEYLIIRLFHKKQNDVYHDVSFARVGELEKQVAVLIATRPYQDALIQSDIRRVAEHADFNLFRRTCRMITGELVLPNTPTVTGYPSYNPCRVDNSTSTPAA